MTYLRNSFAFPKKYLLCEFRFKTVKLITIRGNASTLNKYQRNVKTQFLLIYSGPLSSMLQAFPSLPLDTKSLLCSLILPHRNSNNLRKSLWRERVAELGVNCYSVTDTDKSFQPQQTWLNYFGRHVSQFNHVLQGEITTVFTFCKKTLLLHKLHFHLISSELLWWHPQRTLVGQKEISLLLHRRSLWMPEGKRVLMQNNIKAGQSQA